MAMSCPSISFGIDQVGPFCIGDDVAIQLTTSLTGSDGSGTLVFADSTYNVGGNFTSAGLTPGFYTVTAVFEEGGCPFPASIDIEITDLPDPSFSLATDPICIGEVVGADAGAEVVGWSYAWLVPDVSATVVATSTTTRDISWSTVGTKEVTLIVTDVNGCEDRSTETIEVVAPLSIPVIGCGIASYTSVEFNWNTEAGVDSFQVSINGGTPFFQDSTNFFVGGLSDGELVNIQVIAFGSGACGNSPMGMEDCETESCPTITVTPPNAQVFCLGAMGNTIPLAATQTGAGGTGGVFFSGPGVTGNAGAFSFDADAAGSGTHMITAVYNESVCSGMATFEFTVNAPPTSDFNLNGLAANLTVCEGEVFTLAYGGDLPQAANGTFDWDFTPAIGGADGGYESYNLSYANAGDYIISLSVNDNGCESDTTRFNVTVEAPLATPVIGCGTSSYSSVEFTWNTEAGVDSFLVTINGGTAFFQDSTNLVVGGLSEGEIVDVQVVAFGSGNCGNSLMGMGNCQAERCPAITVIPPNTQTFCLGATGNTIPLAATQTGAGGTGQFTFNGPGVTDNAGVFSFDADAAGLGTHMITVVYDESICSGMATFEFTVNAPPTSDFTLNGLAANLTVCEGEVFILAYSGDLPQAANGTFDWDFTPAIGGADGGYESYNLSYANAGDYIISLSVNDNGCESDTTRFNVTVEAPLATPVIGCGTSSYSSVEFTWNTEAGVDSFLVTINGGTAFFQDSTNLVVGGLSEGEIVDVQVVAISSGNCGNSLMGMGNCQAERCPAITVIPPNTQTFCLGATGNTIPLAATQTGAGGTGQFTFNGPGVTGNAGAFSFDADAAGLGTHVITVVYDESVCSGMTTFEFTVNGPPTSDFTLNGLPATLTVCEGEAFTLAYSGDLPQVANGMFTWDFTPAIGGADGGYESYNLSYANAGDYVISLSVNDNGCESEISRLNVTVEAAPSAPVVSCTASTLSSVTFGWAPAPGAEGYLLSDGTTLGPNELSYTVSGLLPGELATLTVVALSSIACGNSLPSTVADCAADFDDCSNGATFTEPCDDNNSNTINDSVTRLLRDSSVCEPCRGAPCDFAISLDFDLTIGIGDSIQLNLVSNAGIDSITWGNTPGLSCLDCEEPIAKPTETTTYFVTAFDENGCASGTNITIIVNQERNIYVPNVFSPNGDGINDYFEIQGGPDVRLIRGFNVYDRWGAMAFNAVDYPVNSPEGRWQGDHRGQPVEAGVYIYVAVVEFTDGHIEKISGEVLVMK